MKALQERSVYTLKLPPFVLSRRIVTRNSKTDVSAGNFKSMREALWRRAEMVFSKLEAALNMQAEACALDAKEHFPVYAGV
jgi:hypothetical protein